MTAELGVQARGAIDDAWKAGEAAVSAISFWEMSMLHEKRRLGIFLLTLAPCERICLPKACSRLPMNGAVGIRAVRACPDLPRDPADRIVVATALEGYRLVTADRGILEWSGALDRMDARA